MWLACPGACKGGSSPPWRFLWTQGSSHIPGLGPLCCLTSVLGALSDHTLCTMDQDSSRSGRGLWHPYLLPISSSTRFISTPPTGQSTEKSQYRKLTWRVSSSLVSDLDSVALKTLELVCLDRCGRVWKCRLEKPKAEQKDWCWLKFRKLSHIPESQTGPMSVLGILHSGYLLGNYLSKPNSRTESFLSPVTYNKDFGHSHESFQCRQVQRTVLGPQGGPKGSSE